MKVRSLKPWARRPFAERLEALRRAAHGVNVRNRDGIDADEAADVVARLGPYFSDLAVEQSTETTEAGEQMVWQLVVGHYMCPGCRADFDAKDLKAKLGGGEIRCPSCDTMVVAPEKEDDGGEADAPASGG